MSFCAGIDAGLSGAIDEIQVFNIVGTFNIADTDVSERGRSRV